MIAYLQFKNPVIILGAKSTHHILTLDKITIHDSFIQLLVDDDYFSTPLSNVKKIEVTEYDDVIDYDD